MGHGEVREMEITIPNEVMELIAKRGIKEADVKDVIETAESSNKKIVANGRNIAKKRIGEATIYVDYDLEKGLIRKHATVKSAYSHRLALGKIVNATDKSDWVCAHCNAPAMYGHVEMTYMQVTRNGPAVVCPKCNDSWVEEYLATKTLAAVEGLFEKKRA